jgi:hypothetical protein
LSISQRLCSPRAAHTQNTPHSQDDEIEAGGGRMVRASSLAEVRQMQEAEAAAAAGAVGGAPADAGGSGGLGGAARRLGALEWAFD